MTTRRKRRRRRRMTRRMMMTRRTTMRTTNPVSRSPLLITTHEHRANDEDDWIDEGIPRPEVESVIREHRSSWKTVIKRLKHKATKRESLLL